MVRLWKEWLPLWIAFAAVVAGCNASAIYSHEGRKAPAAAVSPRSQWKAFGDLREPGKAIDGTTSTAAVSGRVYNGATLTVDLGKPCVFNMVAIDHGGEEKGFCSRIILLSSIDGKTYEYRWAGPGTRRVTNLCPIRPILARYIRVQAVVSGDRPWSIAEMYVQ